MVVTSFCDCVLAGDVTAHARARVCARARGKHSAHAQTTPVPVPCAAICLSACTVS